MVGQDAILSYSACKNIVNFYFQNQYKIIIMKKNMNHRLIYFQQLIRFNKNFGEFYIF